MEKDNTENTKRHALSNVGKSLPKKFLQPGLGKVRSKIMATQVRALLEEAGLSQVGAARELCINDRTMRGYCAGEEVPRVVILALERLVAKAKAGKLEAKNLR